MTYLNKTAYAVCSICGGFFGHLSGKTFSHLKCTKYQIEPDGSVGDKLNEENYIICCECETQFEQVMKRVDPFEDASQTQGEDHG